MATSNEEKFGDWLNEMWEVYRARGGTEPSFVNAMKFEFHARNKTQMTAHTMPEAEWQKIEAMVRDNQGRFMTIGTPPEKGKQKRSSKPATV